MNRTNPYTKKLNENMSWDIVLFNSKQRIESVSKLEESQLETIDFNAVFENLFSDIKKEGNQREIIGEDFSIEYYASKPNSNQMLQIYGKKAIYVLIELAKQNRWQIYDSGIDAMIDLENPEANGYKNHQAYVKQILKTK